jgi:hypothetical protein
MREVSVIFRRINMVEVILKRRIVMCKKLFCLIFAVLMLGLVLPGMAHALEANLIGFWTLDQTSGTTAYDASGNGNDGTLMGDPKWTVGKIGGALELDGTGDYVDCGNGDVLNITQQVTLAAWVKANSGFAYPDWSGIIMRGGPNIDTFALYYNGPSQQVGFKTTGTNPAWMAVPAAGLFDDGWHHVAATYDGAKKIIYLDGEQIGTMDSIGSIETSTGRLLLGAGRDVIPPTHLLVGLLDDARIYDGALSQIEIQSIMEGGEGYPYALGPSPADGALHMNTWVTLGWAPGDFAVSHDVYMGDNFEDVDNGTADAFRGNQTTNFYVAGFPGYAFPDGLVPGTTYYWRIDEVNEADPNSPWKGDIWSFSIPPKTAYNPSPADGTEFVKPDAALSWTAGYGAKLHTVYLGDDFEDINNAAGGLPLGVTTYNPGPLDLAKVYYWRIDEFDGAGTYKGDVWSFTTPGAVGSLNPANGAVDVKMTTSLSWTPADNAASHEVYFGTDKDAVRSATTASAEYKGSRAIGFESYNPGKLAWNSTYYWRVDEVDSLGGLSKGPLWSFTTADFILIEDFEDYDAGDNQIWYAWHDGLGYGTPGNEPYFAGNGTGAAVGDETTASYCEESIVHGGGKSMPILYDNNKQGFSMYSEVEFTLSEARNWTDEGVNELSLWFRGVSSNAAEPLYVAVANRTGSPAVVTHDDPAAAQLGAWTKWIVPLQAFADQGIDLTDVDRIMVGLGTKGNLTTPGGAGKMYFDDIRLDR